MVKSLAGVTDAKRAAADSLPTLPVHLGEWAHRNQNRGVTHPNHSCCSLTNYQYVFPLALINSSLPHCRRSRGTCILVYNRIGKSKNKLGRTVHETKMERKRVRMTSKGSCSSELCSFRTLLPLQNVTGGQLRQAIFEGSF